MVDVDRRPLGADAHGDQVAVPGSELLQREEQLLSLGATSRAPQPLLGLTIRQVQALELFLRLPRASFARSAAASTSAVDASAGTKSASR